MGRRRLRSDDTNRVPRPELRWQLVAVLIVREGTQVGVCVRFENKDPHGSVFADALGGLGLAVGVVPWLFARSRDRAIENCPLASGLTKPTHRLAFLASWLLGRLFVKAPSFHVTKDSLTLHFLFQNTEGLLNIVVSNKNLQLTFLCLREGKSFCRSIRRCFLIFFLNAGRHTRRLIISCWSDNL
jgi:hypothetical protein